MLVTHLLNHGCISTSPRLRTQPRRTQSRTASEPATRRTLAPTRRRTQATQPGQPRLCPRGTAKTASLYCTSCSRIIFGAIKDIGHSLPLAFSVTSSSYSTLPMIGMIFKSAAKSILPLNALQLCASSNNEDTFEYLLGSLRSKTAKKRAPCLLSVTPRYKCMTYKL